MQPSFDLSGRTAVVTGAHTGIGQAIAVALASAGAAVVGVGRSGMAETEGQIAEQGGRFVSLSDDLSSIVPVEASVEAAASTFGSVDMPVSRLGAGELGGASVFLGSDVHGTILPVDGGWLAR